MPKKYDLPSMPFYVGDWLKCPEVRALPPDYRGLWFDLICFMWESTERGVMVKPNGKPYENAEIIRMVGLDNQNSGIWLTVLLENNVCSRREDGAIYSRKMIRDEEIRTIRREVGSRGGNPSLLVNQGLTSLVNQNTESEIEDEKGFKKRIVKGKQFEAPTVAMVEAYCKEQGFKIDVQHMVDYYVSNGWKVGRNPMKDWKAAVRNWVRRNGSTEKMSKLPAAIRVMNFRVLKMSDREIMDKLMAEKYSEHEINEALGKRY